MHKILNDIFGEKAVELSTEKADIAKRVNELSKIVSRGLNPSQREIDFMGLETEAEKENIIARLERIRVMAKLILFTLEATEREKLEIQEKLWTLENPPQTDES